MKIELLVEAIIYCYYYVFIFIMTDNSLILEAMKTVCTGLYAKGHSWIGYSNGTVALKNVDLYIPEAGTYKS